MSQGKQLDGSGQRLDEARVAVLILAGGNGTRLWPLSTRQRPKQFVRLVDRDRTMLQLTWQRVPAYVPRTRVFVNVARGFESLALEQLPDLDTRNLIVAPEERSTLPIAGFATAFIEERVPGATVLMLASDNLIGEHDSYHAALHDCLVSAQAGPHLVALGVKPTFASTHYGYMTIGAKAPFGSDAWFGAGYLEKPRADVAERLLAEACHDWNAGVFAWDAGVFFDACRLHAPQHHEVLHQMRGRAGKTVQSTPSADEALAHLFSQLPVQDIDHGLMEHLRDPGESTTQPRLVLVRGRFAWDDIGHFATLRTHLPTDAAANAVMGAVQATQTRDSILICEAPYELQVHGGDGLLVAVSNEGHVAVCPRRRAAELPALVAQPLFCGLALNGDLVPVPTTHFNGSPINAFAHIADVQRVRLRCDGNSVMAALGLDDVDVTIQGRQVTVRTRTRTRSDEPAAAAAAHTAPSWLVVDEDHEAMSLRAAECLLQDLHACLLLRERPVVVLSAGHTPTHLYSLLRGRHRHALDWTRLQFFQMDEYVPRRPDDRGLFRRFLEQALVAPLGLSARLLNGDESAGALREHEAGIEAAGGIDLLLHGIGTNGHLGFNEPGSPFDGTARKVTLAESTRPKDIEENRRPIEGVTLGLGLLNRARRVRLIASGGSKRAAMHAAILGPRDEACPASGLQRHADLKVFIDRHACGWMGVAHV
jgi:mannose-1-phosphate guanylyltransferase